MLTLLIMINTIDNTYSFSTQATPFLGIVTYPSDATLQTQKSESSSRTGNELSQSAKVSISQEALDKLGFAQNTQGVEKNDGKSSPSESDQKLSEQEQNDVDELKQIDGKVRRHEEAHMAAGGDLVRGGVSYGYKVGPDGKSYAVSGEVSIDTSVVKDDPDATIQKMEKVKRAALAPADPSGQDRSVASDAAQKEAEAQMEKIQE